MIGGVGLAINFDAADAASQVFCVKTKSLTIRAVGRLRMIV